MEEDRHHEVWGTKLDYFASIFSQTIGLPNIWRFSHLVLQSGGGVFFIPYLASNFLLGVPLFCLEIFVAQFASLGPITIWEINLLLKGTGYATILLAGISCLDCVHVVSISMWYLIASMSDPFPWSSCGNKWSTCNCGAGANRSHRGIVWHNDSDLNCTGVVVNRTSTSEDYFSQYVVSEAGRSINLKITLCQLLSWALAFVFLMNGIKSMGKAMYFFAIFPYIMLTAFFIVSIFLPGAPTGVAYYLNVNTDKMLNPTLWYNAVSQVFISLGLCNGNLMTLASYNNFHNNPFTDGIIVSSVNVVTSFYVGFITFSVLGILAEQLGQTVEEVASKGYALIFVVYPEALEHMPGAHFWALCHFTMLVCVGMGSIIPMAHSIFAAFEEEFQWLQEGRRSITFRATGCVLAFCLNITWTTEQGERFSNYLDDLSGFPLLIIAIVDIIAFVLVYGLKNTSEDVKLIAASSDRMLCMYKYFFKWSWAVVMPVLIIVLLISSIFVFDISPYASAMNDHWTGQIVMTYIVFSMLLIPVWTIVKFIIEYRRRSPQESVRDVFLRFSRPSHMWGPALRINRFQSVRYSQFMILCSPPKETRNSEFSEEESPMEKVLEEKSPEERSTDMEKFLEEKSPEERSTESWESSMYDTAPLGTEI